MNDQGQVQSKKVEDNFIKSLALVSQTVDKNLL
jgi:hypothetical protein